jgi:hypothetical protein
MKHKTITLLLALSLPTICFAQLKVDSLGHVSIHGNTNPAYALNIEGDSYTTGKIRICGEKSTIFLNPTSSDTLQDTNAIGLDVYSRMNTRKTNFGIRSIVYGEAIPTTSVALFGLGRAVTPANSIGVYGTTNYSLHSAGIYGTVSDFMVPTNVNIDGNYAGFFRGNVKVTGTINGVLLSNSEANQMDDIVHLTNKGESSLEKISFLHPVSFRYKHIEQDDEEAYTRETTEDKEYSNMKKYEEYQRKIANKTHFGFIAKELQKAYPNLVYEQENGTLTINYVEMIPILVQSIKELKEQLEELKDLQVLKSKTNNGKVADIDSESISLTSISQNSPNPFSERTEIAITLPESVQKAMLYIYDMTGKQVEQHEITERGNTSMTIYADRMDAGMYIYALVADGKVITSKKMIVTK